LTFFISKTKEVVVSVVVPVTIFDFIVEQLPRPCVIIRCQLAHISNNFLAVCNLIVTHLNLLTCHAWKQVVLPDGMKEIVDGSSMTAQTSRSSVYPKHATWLGGTPAWIKVHVSKLKYGSRPDYRKWRVNTDWLCDVN